MLFQKRALPDADITRCIERMRSEREQYLAYLADRFDLSRQQAVELECKLRVMADIKCEELLGWMA